MDFKSTRKRRYKRKPKPWTPICHHTREAYSAYKWYKNLESFYRKSSRGELILMAMPEYDNVWNIIRYQRVYVEIQQLQPYYNKFLEKLDFIVNVKEEE